VQPREEIDIVIKKEFENKLASGYPLLLKEHIAQSSKPLREGALLNLHNSKNVFFAKAYHGEQNKGSGWVLTKSKKQKIDQSFFQEIRTCVLLDKPSRRVEDIEADFVGFKIPDHFVVGYGLDWDELGRNLKGIYKVG
jgi:23S rRNA G2069 N7-methylase RlmK/C1962 C5-methylase RlmI